MSPAGPRLHLQRCRGFQVAIALGVLLTFTGAVDGNPIPIVVGVVGTAVALFVWLRECRPDAEES
jgi:hypothetical protein